MDIQWDELQRAWEQGDDNLPNMLSKHGLSLLDISLKANQLGWGDRGAKKPIVGSFGTDILTDAQVSLAHKTDLGRIRLIAACVLEHLQGEADLHEVLKMAERITKIYSQIIPLERKVFGLDMNSDEAPDGISINIKK